MAFDGCFFHMMIPELSICEGSFVDKIFQPSRDELVFLLRTKQGSRRLFISARPGAARMQFTSSAPENPPTPPMFCMLLRKHLGSARLINIEQPELERVAVLRFSCLSEMGDRVNPKLVVEMIGSSPNLILIGDDGRILDCIRRSDIENPSARLLQPGATYTLPEATLKLNPLTETADKLMLACLELPEQTISSAIVSKISGVSPQTAKRIATMAEIDPNRAVSSLGGWEDKLRNAFKEFQSILKTKSGKPLLIEKDFTFLDLSDSAGKVFDTYSELLDNFYLERERLERTASLSRDLLKLVVNLEKRSNRKLQLRLSELEQCKDRENLRLFGELLKANLHSIRPGSTFAEVLNYYDPELSTIKIPLSPALSPAANATKYFKEYKKACSAEQTLGHLIAENREELIYLESVFDALSRADSPALLDDIRAELTALGYLRKPANIKSKKAATKPLTLISPAGFTVSVGRNNTQNDNITTRLSDKCDLWFHTKNIPGSHVVIHTLGNPVPDEDILFAATVAAKHSKAASSGKVPVDYTEIKNVKKPAGSKPGMVIYKHNFTIFVNPTL